MRLYDYAASANCYKPRLLLAQLDQPYERVPIDTFGGDTLTDEFAARNPARSTPVLETDDGRYLQESNAILWYLADGTSFPPDECRRCRRHSRRSSVHGFEQHATHHLRLGEGPNRQRDDLLGELSQEPAGPVI